MSIAPQTTYSRYFTAAFAGQLGDTGNLRIESFVNLTAATQPVGIGVAIDATVAGAFAALSASTSKLAGIIANSFARSPGDATTQLSGTYDAIIANAVAPLVTEGSVWVVTEGTVQVGDIPYIRYSANGTGKLQVGAFGTTAGTTDASHCRQVYGGRWLSNNITANDGRQIALLYISVATDRASV